MQVLEADERRVRLSSLQTGCRERLPACISDGIRLDWWFQPAGPAEHLHAVPQAIVEVPPHHAPPLPRCEAQLDSCSQQYDSWAPALPSDLGLPAVHNHQARLKTAARSPINELKEQRATTAAATFRSPSHPFRRVPDKILLAQINKSEVKPSPGALGLLRVMLFMCWHEVPLVSPLEQR